MGNNHEKYFSKKKRKVLILGLSNSGKTTVLKYMLTNKFVEDCEPTSTFNAEELKYKKFSLAIWDLGGKTPHLWVHHYIGTQGIVFVIDSNDMHKYDDVKKELLSVLLNADLNMASIYIFLNKADKGKKIIMSTLRKDINFDEFENKKIFMNEGSIKVGSGINEGLEWLNKNMQPI